LAYNATKDDIRDAVLRFGDVTEVVVPEERTGENRGYAFVIFAASDGAHALRRATAGAVVNVLGRALRVDQGVSAGQKADEERLRRRVFVGNVS
jgi:RNA recognition motif-containing protein